jgi:hypothetical protein
MAPKTAIASDEGNTGDLEGGSDVVAVSSVTRTEARIKVIDESNIHQTGCTISDVSCALRVAASNQNQPSVSSWRSASDEDSTKTGGPEASGNRGVSVIDESNTQQMSCLGQPWECVCNSSAVLVVLCLLYFFPRPLPIFIIVIAIMQAVCYVGYICKLCKNHLGEAQET